MKKRIVRNCVIPLTALLIAGVSLCLDSGRKSGSELSVKNLLPEFSMEDPAKIIVSWKNQKTTLVYANGEWLIRERENHPADQNMVTNLLEDIRKIRPLRRAVPADRETCSRLRVNPEESDPSRFPGMRVRIYNAEGRALRDLTFGFGYYGLSMQAGTDPQGRWLGIVEDEGKRVIPFLVSSVFEAYHPVTGGWMGVPFFDNGSQNVRIHYQPEEKDGSEWLLARISPEEQFTNVIPGGAITDPEKLRQWTALTGGRFIYDGFQEKNCGPLKKIGTLSVAEKSGLQRSLTFYRSEKEKNGVLCKVSGSYRGTDPLVRKRLEYFLKGRTGWLYLIPEKIYETIRSNPAGE